MLPAWRPQTMASQTQLVNPDVSPHLNNKTTTEPNVWNWWTAPKIEKYKDL